MIEPSVEGSKDQRITIRVIGKTGSVAKNAISDTGSTERVVFYA